jgi:hypothetical protein
LYIGLNFYIVLEMSETQFTNVHTFDGQLGTFFQPTREFTKTEKREMITRLIDRCTIPSAKHMLATIVEDLNNHNNIDTSNNVDSSNILAEICKKLEDNSEIEVSFIEEQIADISALGPCPQGRTTRFLQIWQAIKDC